MHVCTVLSGRLSCTAADTGCRNDSAIDVIAPTYVSLLSLEILLFFTGRVVYDVLQKYHMRYMREQDWILRVGMIC